MTNTFIQTNSESHMAATRFDLARAILFEQRLIQLSEKRGGNLRIRLFHIKLRGRLLAAFTECV